MRHKYCLLRCPDGKHLYTLSSHTTLTTRCRCITMSVNYPSKTPSRPSSPIWRSSGAPVVTWPSGKHGFRPGCVERVTTADQLRGSVRRTSVARLPIHPDVGMYAMEVVRPPLVSGVQMFAGFSRQQMSSGVVICGEFLHSAFVTWMSRKIVSGRY